MSLLELDEGTRESLGVGAPEGVHRVKTIRTPNDITSIGQEGVSRLLGNTQVREALIKPGTIERLTKIYGPGAARKLKPKS